MGVIAQVKGRSHTKLLHFVVILVLLVFIGRLFQLQIIRHDDYASLALAEQEKKFTIPATRGNIFLRDGEEGAVPIVLNETLKTVYGDPRYVDDLEGTAFALAEVLDGDAGRYRDLLEDRERAYVTLEKRVPLDIADKIKEKQLSGIGLQDVDVRVYPEGQLASQLLGFVNDEGVGQYGVESALDEDLNGTPGLLEAITDVRGIPLATNDDNVVRPAVNGVDVTLTIDRNIQQMTEEALKKTVEESKSKSGSALVIDPHSGAILAMANFPTYDPGKFTDVEDYTVFQNRVVDNAYESGSVIKPFTMAAGLNEGAVTADSTYRDTGSVQIADWQIYNADRRSWGVRTMADVIRLSINTGVIHVLEQLGGGSINDTAKNTLYDYFTNKFGFGYSLNTAQGTDAAGIVFEPDSVQGNDVRYGNMTFGQGMTVTMLQVASAFSALVNGGTYYQPYLVDSTVATDGTETHSEPQILRSGVISPEVSETLKSMLVGVVEGGGGRSAQKNGYVIGGKTGTAQIPDEFGNYSEDREIGSFVGFGANNEVEYVVMTRIDEPEIRGFAGSGAAAPLFGEISNWLINYYQIPPVR